MARSHPALLPYLPGDLILQCYEDAPGDEINSGKFASPESSAALVANTFGYFLDKTGAFPPLPKLACAWPATAMWLERMVRFPWHGGRHPCLDVLIETPDALIGIESKRYEPYRSKQHAEWSKAYSRDVWGNQMGGFTSLRDSLDHDGIFVHLDAAQLIKHAYGLRSETAGSGPFAGKRPFLIYLHAEPATWPDGTPIAPALHTRHQDEIALFSARVSEDEVGFSSLTYRELLSSWRSFPTAGVARHATQVSEHYFSDPSETSQVGASL